MLCSKAQWCILSRYAEGFCEILSWTHTDNSEHYSHSHSVNPVVLLSATTCGQTLPNIAWSFYGSFHSWQVLKGFAFVPTAYQMICFVGYDKNMCALSATFWLNLAVNINSTHNCLQQKVDRISSYENNVL